MFMSFGNTPRILRLFCRSEIVEWNDPKFGDLVRRVSKGKREAFDGARAVVVARVWQVQTSCGYGVPRVNKAITRRSSLSYPSLKPDPRWTSGRVPKSKPASYSNTRRQTTSRA